jgi:hypothetical protein
MIECEGEPDTGASHDRKAGGIDRRRWCYRSSFPKALSAAGRNSTRQAMAALDLGLGDGLPALGACRLHRARVRELFQIRFDRPPQQRRFRLAGTPRFAGQRGVDLGGKFQVHSCWGRKASRVGMVGRVGKRIPDRKGAAPRVMGVCRAPESPYDASMDDSVRRTVKISPCTDEAVRAYLGRRRSSRALSRLVEDALRARIFEKSTERVKGMTAGVGAAKLRGIVKQAVRYARRRARIELEADLILEGGT